METTEGNRPKFRLCGNEGNGMSKNTDIDDGELSKRLRNVFTISELLSCYKPDSEPETNFGDIYSNVGFLIMDEMEAANKALNGGKS